MNKNVVVNVKEEKPSILSLVLELSINIIVYALILMLASVVFSNNFYVSNIGYAILGAIILSILNATIKPLLVFLTLPITFISCGVLYPIVNIIVLKFTGLILGSNFVVTGWLVPFFIALFISASKIFLDTLIVRPIVRSIRNHE
ncbi:MAG: phage holin family protein [Bacilli bacterium]